MEFLSWSEMLISVTATHLMKRTQNQPLRYEKPWCERHWMRLLEHLNSFLPYPAGIQMCHPFWCKEYHDDFWGQQGLQSRTQQKVRLQVSMWLSVKGQGKDYCVCFVVFFTGKKAFAEKSLHIWQYVLLKHLKCFVTRNLAIRMSNITGDQYWAIVKSSLVYCVWFWTSCCKGYSEKLA